MPKVLVLDTVSPEVVAMMEAKYEVIDLVRCEECKWWQNPCYGYGAYGYCSDGIRKEETDADVS